MPKVSPLQSNFNGGEFSPLFYGRVDSDRYKTALATCLNYIPTIQGPLTRRPGTMFVSEVKTSSKRVRILSFEFSITQAYILEFGDFYVRFYKDHGQILDDLSAIYEIASPYSQTDLAQIKFTQSADVLYLAHPNYPTRKLIRRGHADWSLLAIEFLDGPYLPTNTAAVTLTPGAIVGSTTLVAGPSATITNIVGPTGQEYTVTAVGHGWITGQVVYISGVLGVNSANGVHTITRVDADHFKLQGIVWKSLTTYVSGGTAVPSLFASTDVGRAVRLREGSVWGWALITAYTNPGSVSIEVKSTLTSTAAKTAWRLGVWSVTTGYPTCVVFHEDRLMLAGPSAFPQRLDGSRSGDYENFAPTDTDGTITASHAIGFSLNARDVNVIRWMTSDEKGLLVGSVGGEWVVKPSSQNEALSPTNINAKPSSSFGSADIQPVQVGKASIFIQRSSRKVREMTYFYDVDGFRAPDITHLAEHMTVGGITEMVHQKEPQSLIWAVRGDGALIGSTYERDSDSLSVGWHRHTIGGVSDAAGSMAEVESLAVIPAPDGTRREVWMVVKRYIDGAVVRYIEYMTKLFEEEDEQQDAFFVDCGLTYDSPITITGVTAANPPVVTAAAHGLSNGDEVRISEVLGMEELNDVTFTVANKTTNTFQLSGVNGTSYAAYVSGGEVRKLVTTITGLGHLEGETVDILADGAVRPSTTVASGSITLGHKAAVVQIGLGYVSDAQMLRLEAGAADGTALGKVRRTHRVSFLLHRSLGLKIGTSFDKLTTLVFRKASDALTRAPALFSGILSENLDAPYDFENQICWRQSQPLPSTIQAVMPQMVTQDR